MKVEVQLFAIAKDLAGCPSVMVELPANATVQSLRQNLGVIAPALRPILASTSIAVNNEYATAEAVIPPGANVACIPPVSGG